MSLQNICNRTVSDMGIQLEIYRGLREDLNDSESLLRKFAHSIRKTQVVAYQGDCMLKMLEEMRPVVIVPPGPHPFGSRPGVDLLVLLDGGGHKPPQQRQEYNTERPHSALDYQTPAKFAASYVAHSALTTAPT